MEPNRGSQPAPVLGVRPVTPDDIPLVRSLADVIWRAHYPGLISVSQIDYMLGRMYASDVIQEELATGFIWELTMADGEPIGFFSYSLDPPASRLKLHKLYLLPAHHGRGVGRWMLGVVRDRAATAGLHKVQLTVNKRNSKAIRAYERAGFRITDAIVSDIGGGFVMDDYIMTLEWRTTASRPDAGGV